MIDTPKTVYDPKIISDEQIIEWGKEAMKNGTIDGNRVFGTSNNGLKFVGYLKSNSNTEIKNFYPIIN